jgi:hypothetical protein
MAILQAQASVPNGSIVAGLTAIQSELTSSIGYTFNTTSVLQHEVVSSTGYLANTNLLSQAAINNSIGVVIDSLTRVAAINNVPISNYQAYQSKFARFFGVGAKQDATKLYIQKADLGLTLGNNTAEAILTALLLQVATKESNYFISRVFVDLFKQEYIKEDTESYIVTILLIKLFAPLTFKYGDPDISLESNAANPITVSEFN